MRRDVIWAAAEGAGFEHLRLAWDDSGVVADGLVVVEADGTLFRARYDVRCDAEWRVRSVRVAMLDDDPRTLDLRHEDGRGWSTGDGLELVAFRECTEVDISATPFTNTLPVRRLGLKPGEAADLKVTYIDLPMLSVAPERQRYSCLETRDDGALYRFDAIPSGFTADLPLDADGLVLDYPGLFRRVWSGSG